MKADIVLTVSESKRLIAKGVARLDVVQARLRRGLIMISSGTTNAYVVEELLGEAMDKRSYVTGRIRPAGKRLEWPPLRSDVVLRDGVLDPTLDRFSAVKAMQAGDFFIKGANALNYRRGVAGILVGSESGGTIGGTLGYIIAKKLRLLIPVGLEKEVAFDIEEAARLTQEPDEEARPVTSLFPVRGHIFTEIEALRALADVEAVQVAAGGIAGAEGAVWLLLRGTPEQVRRGLEMVESVQGEPPFSP